MDKLLLGGLGGALGAMARYLTNVQMGRLLGPAAPWAGTLTVNLVGGLLMGTLVGYLAHRGGESPRLKEIAQGGNLYAAVSADEQAVDFNRRGFALVVIHGGGRPWDR